MKFLVGSTYFFKDFEDFESKDIDYVITELFPKHYSNTMTIRGNGVDYMYFRRRSKHEFIRMSLNSNLPMVVGKFLIPEFNNYLKFTIEDLKVLEPQFRKMDKEHLYETYIYDCYIANGEFKLTQDQLNEAYKIYK